MRFINTSHASVLVGCMTLAAAFSFASVANAQTASKAATHLGFTVAETAGGQIYMDTVTANSPAGRRGLQKGDRILLVGQTVARTAEGVQQAINAMNTGDTVRLTLSRDQHVGTVTLQLAPATTDATAVAPPGKDLLLLGMGLTPDKAGRPLVAAVSAESPAAKAGIQQGDVVQQIDGMEPASFKQFADTARNVLDNDARETVVLTLSRRGESFRAVIKLMPDPTVVARTQGMQRGWGAPARMQAAVAHLDRLNGGSQTKRYVGNIRFLSQLEVTRANARISGLAPGYYVIAAHSHGDLSQIDVQPMAIGAPGDDSPEDTATDNDGPDLKQSTTLKSGDTLVPPKPRKTTAERMIEDVPPVTPASAARANAGVEPASETEAAASARRSAAAELARRRAIFRADMKPTAVENEPVVVLATVNVDELGNSATTSKFDGDVDSLAGLAVAVYPIERADMTRLAAGGAIGTRNLRAPVAAGLVGYAVATPAAPDADAPAVDALDNDELRDVRNDGVIDRGIDASGRIEPIPPRTGAPLERE